MSIFGRIRKDILFVVGIGKAVLRVTRMARRRTRTFPDVVDELAGRFPDKPALLSDSETFTYAQFNARANRYARWARANGIAKGETQYSNCAPPGRGALCCCSEPRPGSPGPTTEYPRAQCRGLPIAALRPTRAQVGNIEWRKHAAWGSVALG